MKNTVCKRALSVFTVCFVFSAIIILFTLRWTKEKQTHKLITEQYKVISTLYDNYLDRLPSASPEEKDRILSDIADLLNHRIILISHYGIVLFDSEGRNNTFTTDRELALALRGHITILPDSEKQTFIVSIPLKEHDDTFAVLRYYVPVKNYSFTLFRPVTVTIILALLLITGIIPLAYFYRVFFLPCSELSYTVDNLLQGNLNSRLLLKQESPFYELAENLNRYSDSIQEQILTLSRQKEQADSIIASINEGVMVLDKQQRIILHNKPFEDIVKTRVSPKTLCWEVIKSAELTELIKQVQATRQQQTSQIYYKGNYFHCSAAYIPAQEVTVLLFYNITSLKSIEKIKKDLVVNASHELRTPLTAIRGFVETLEGEVDGQAQNYLQIIMRHTDRMIHLVEDMMLLTKLEEQKAAFKPEKINLHSLLAGIIPVFEKRIRSKNLEINLDFSSSGPYVKADHYQLEQVFINLVDNAVKYTDKGSITLSTHNILKTVHVKVSDTGSGIPLRYHSRIFERFFVVDKSRSRSMGGTGLGLSIVKHILLLHRAEIYLDSSPGSGTTFTIVFPVCED